MDKFSELREFKRTTSLTQKSIENSRYIKESLLEQKEVMPQKTPQLKSDFHNEEDSSKVLQYLKDSFPSGPSHEKKVGRPKLREEEKRKVINTRVSPKSFRIIEALLLHQVRTLPADKQDAVSLAQEENSNRRIQGKWGKGQVIDYILGQYQENLEDIEEINKRTLEEVSRLFVIRQRIGNQKFGKKWSREELESAFLTEIRYFRRLLVMNGLSDSKKWSSRLGEDGARKISSLFNSEKKIMSERES